jgi:hypothetical protein
MVLAAFMAALQLRGSDETTAIPQPILQTGSRIQWNGGELYQQGVNIPWYNFACDFGCRGEGGVSSPAANAALSAEFAALSESGVHNVRWFLFPGDPWQVTRNNSGAPSAINKDAYADIDAALKLAEANDLYFVFVLFSSSADIPTQWTGDPVQRQQLADVLGELFAHYASNPRIMTWEVVNEPELDIWDGNVNQEDMKDFVRVIAASARANTSANVTVGSAMVDGLPIWQGLGLSYYDVHWYDYMSPGDWCAYCTTAYEIQQRIGTSLPIVVGEFYAGDDVDPATRMQDWYDKGFAGAFAWSLFPERTEDQLGFDVAVLRSFAGNIAENGPSGASQ